MDKKMTSGEIASKAGVSQKALRLYDEKGLLKPVGFSEGNYRLYDEESLAILEKIIVLKHVGFSLEEIKDSLEKKDNESIVISLQNQVALMESKIDELSKAVKCMKSVLARTDGNPDWDDVADIIKKIEYDQRADKRHIFAVNHTADGEDWYGKIYRSLNISENDRILDLGCGYAKLWRNNWSKISENIQIDGYDLHESWAEDFDKYLCVHRNSLAEGTHINLFWKNIEEEDTWEELEKKPQYTKVIAHYLATMINDMETLVSRASKVLAPGGMLSINYFGTDVEYDFWEEKLTELGLDLKFAIEQRAEKEKQHLAMKALLEKYFAKALDVRIPSPLSFDRAEDLLERVLEKYPNGAKYLNAHKAQLIQYFEKELTKAGSVVVRVDTGFWHCCK